MLLKAPDARRRFWRISAAGVFFQGGAAAVDSSTIIAALVHGLICAGGERGNPPPTATMPVTDASEPLTLTIGQRPSLPSTPWLPPYGGNRPGAVRSTLIRRILPDPRSEHKFTSVEGSNLLDTSLYQAIAVPCGREVAAE